MPLDQEPPQMTQPRGYNTEAHNWTSVPIPNYPPSGMSSMGSWQSAPSYQAQGVLTWTLSRVTYVNSDEYHQYIVNYHMYYAAQMSWNTYVNILQSHQNIVFW